MNRCFVIAILICISIKAFGQPKHLFRDTININIENSINIKISSFEMSWLKNEKEILEILNFVKEKISKVSDKLPKNSYKIIYTSGQDILIQELNDYGSYSINQQGDLVKLSMNKCVIIRPKYDIYIDYKDINKLLEIDIQNYVNKILLHRNTKDRYLKETPDKPYFHGISWTDDWLCSKDSISRIGSRWNPHKDNLEIMAGVGTGIVKKQLSPDFYFRIGYFRNQKGGCLKKHFYISDNMVYFFQDNGKIAINNFLNVGFRYNLSNEVYKYNWIGLEFGYLTNSKGDYFKAPTFRLGTIIDLRKNIIISPQVYMENGFKSIYPGIRIGVNITPY